MTIKKSFLYLFLRKQSKKTMIPIQFTICPISLDDMSNICQLMQELWHKMEHQEWFAPDEEISLRDAFSQHKAMGWKVIDSERKSLVGFFIVQFPGKAPDNLGRDIALPEEELEKVAHFDSVMIHPNYRGHHLQKRLIPYGEQAIKKCGYRYIMCTIHPDNIYSLQNTLAEGFEIMTKKLKYGGLPRYILKKELI